MSLELFFVGARTLDLFRSEPLGHVLDDFCVWLGGEGFSRSALRNHLHNTRILNVYLAEQGLSRINRLSASHINGFAEGYPSRCRHRVSKENHVRRVLWSINRFREYMESVGLFDAEIVRNLYDPLLDQYLIWMRDHQQSSTGTLGVRKASITYFLKWLGDEATADGLGRLTGQKVEDFFISFAEEPGRGRSSRRSMQSALRTFLRFALYEGFINQPLDHAVPAFRTYNLGSVPRGLDDQQAEAVLEAAPRDTEVGRRDFAILEMLYAYGIRGGQIRALRLEDIYWEKNQILFRALKHGKDSLLPLTRRVGESLLAYLQNGRPEATAYQEVFLTSRAPYRPLPRPSSLSAIVDRRIHAAGIDIPSKGSHVFRHAFAGRKLAEGHSLKEIADVIGHRHLGTTFQYSKVDATALEQVGLDWPEEEVSS